MRPWLLPLALALLALSSTWLLQRLEREVQAPAARREIPDYYLDEMQRTVTNEAGQVEHVLRARHLRHFPHDDSTELVGPMMEIYNGQQRPWYVTAERGTVSSNSEVVQLYGAVEIWRLDAAGRRELEVLTTGLKVLPDEQYAESDAFTTILTPRSRTVSVGMRANLAHDRLELLDQVQSRYEKAD